MAYTFTNNSGQTISSSNSTPAQMSAFAQSMNSTPSSSGSSSGGGSSGGINQYNPNTGQLLAPGQTVQIGNTGQYVTQGTAFTPPSSNVIPSANLGVTNQMNQPLQFPQIGQQQQDYSWITSALSPNNPDGTLKNAQQVQSDQNSTNLAYLRGMFEAPPSSADSYRKAQQETGILQKQQLVTDLSGKLDAITARGESNKLAVVGQGRGIPSAIIGGQQAEMARETAIEALPVSAQLNAAQGNLQMAEQNLNTLFKIYSDDATNKYNQKQKINEAFYTILTGQQKAQLDRIDKLETRTYNEGIQAQQDAKEFAKMAFQNNQSSLGSKIMALDPKSPTYKAQVSKLAGGIYDSGKALDDELKRVTIDTKVQEIANAKLPGAGKPPTEGQVASAGYADRINQANTIIDSKADVFKKMTYADFKLAESKSQIANAFMSKDVRQASQAMRNFITAKLRKESGAAISPSEFDDARLQYFPAYNDDAQTLLQKKQLRDSVYNNLVLGAGSAYTPNTVNSYLDNSVIPSLNNLSLPNATNYWNSITNP